MPRYLIAGNLSYKEKQDMKLFFGHPEAEFMHLGPGKDVFGMERRSHREMLADARAGKYDLVILGSSKHPNFNPRKGWVRNLSNIVGKYLQHPHLMADGAFPFARISTTVAALDLEVNSIVDNRRFPHMEQAACYFKRELPQNPCNAFLYTHPKAECTGNIMRTEPFRHWVPKLRPISLGIADDRAAKLADLNLPKTTDIFFAGTLAERPNRISGIQHLERLKAEGFKVDMPTDRLPFDEFIQRCAQAHLVWSPEGMGWDCYRHYEIAAAGSVPLLQICPLFSHQPFVDNETAIFYPLEGDGLIARIRRALKDRPRLVAMGQATRQHVLKWHTHLALSRYVIEETFRTVGENRQRSASGSPHGPGPVAEGATA
jgi:hypothetical protein